MTTIDEINRKNLRRLADELGSVNQLAFKIERDPSQVSQWLNASTDHRSGKPRGIRPQTCRYIEEKCGKPRGWLDRDHSQPESVAEPARRDEAVLIAELTALYARLNDRDRDIVLDYARDLIALRESALKKAINSN